MRSTKLGFPFENLRIDRVVPLREHGGNTAQIRLPSGKRASRTGLSPSMVRPTNCAMFRTAAIRDCSSRNLASVRSINPRRSTKISSGPLIITSETLSSAKNPTMGDRKVAIESSKTLDDLFPLINQWFRNWGVKSCSEIRLLILAGSDAGTRAWSSSSLTTNRPRAPVIGQ